MVFVLCCDRLLVVCCLLLVLLPVLDLLFVGWLLCLDAGSVWVPLLIVLGMMRS